MITDQN